MLKQPESGTVLEREMQRRHWSREETLVQLARKAREMRVRDYGLSLRQLDRWLSGEVHVPRGPACRVAERLFGHPIAILLSQAVPSKPAPAPTPVPTPAVDDGPLTRRAALKARQHSGVAASSVVDPVSIEALHLQVRRLAREYATTRPVELLHDLVEVRDGAYRLLAVTRRPSDLAELYMIAGQVCGLAATTAWDLGDADAADELAAAAWTYAQLCDHGTLRAWVRSVQATIAFWSGRPTEGLRFAENGLRFATGSAAVRLHAITARAWTLLPGGADRAVVALRLAVDARERDAGVDEMADSVGGEFGFSAARLALCAGAVYLGIGDGAQAARYSGEALHLYQQTPAMQRRWAVHHGALIDLATARAQQGDLDGAAAALGPALQLDPARRTARLTGRLKALRRVVAAPPFRQVRVGRELTEAVDDWTAGALISAPLAALPSGPTVAAPNPSPGHGVPVDPS
ncbi:hypothetical protein Val02_66810 [Virgisporangium aliadipatigenens]|uniref:XRE family transcriptional regulator n=1 Tax=Virgisporangium aliadipatigenens TaxID=741659 RepID=A0A8J4DT06_9ACTN|nr:hypothetical protein [Virgisporangium aliadipatigenens]GIJ49795.1 hypothetical protein Val02_66810 [Virgisporangium aliadipatigenens]